MRNGTSRPLSGCWGIYCSQGGWCSRLPQGSEPACPSCGLISYLPSSLHHSTHCFYSSTTYSTSKRKRAEDSFPCGPLSLNPLAHVLTFFRSLSNATCPVRPSLSSLANIHHGIPSPPPISVHLPSQSFLCSTDPPIPCNLFARIILAVCLPHQNITQGGQRFLSVLFRSVSRAPRTGLGTENELRESKATVKD